MRTLVETLMLIVCSAFMVMCGTVVIEGISGSYLLSDVLVQAVRNVMEWEPWK